MIRRFFCLTLLVVIGTTGCRTGTSMGWGQFTRPFQQIRQPMHERPAHIQPEATERLSRQPAPERLVMQAGHQVVEPATLVTLGPADDLNAILQQHPGTVLVDFYADWCGPCRRQSALLHELEPLARQQGSRIIKVNIDAHPDVAQQYQVSRLPTLVLLDGGRPVQRHTGLVPADQLTRWLSR